MKRYNHLKFNQPAPDFTLPDTRGKDVRLSDLWAKRPLLLAFTRHFGCTQCKQMLDELVAGKQRIQAAGLDIAVITQGTVETTALFALQFAPGLLCLCDPQREVYHAYGLVKGSIFQTFLNLKVMRAVSLARRKGYQVEQPPDGQDAMQMSATFIINSNGRVVLPFYYDHIADHPPLDLLLSGVLETGWNQDFDGPLGPIS